MEFERSSGLLLHPTSLPGRFGIGELGAEAYRFIDFLAASEQKLWQIFPLGPTGYGDSPYQCFSAFAGNPLLISLDKLLEDGLLVSADVPRIPDFDDQAVDYGKVIPWKYGLLWRAYERFAAAPDADRRAAFERFCADQRAWLDDFALFMALKGQHNGAAWNTWEWDLINRTPAALERWRTQLATQIAYQQFLQFTFFRQWADVKAYAHQQGVKIIGDIPIFVAFDSADAWAHRDLFYFDAAGSPTFVAGVPPDYFSATGQLWGNPLYRWDVMQAQGYAWWIERFVKTFEIVDIVRLDHFRGFEKYWRVPFGNPTAEIGTWEPGSGEALFRAVEAAIGKLPIIAEDLGVITPEVVALRTAFDFPGMKVLQFAFDAKEADDKFLPHTYEKNYVVYTGTHDNDTTAGWYQKLTGEIRDWANTYLDLEDRDPCWTMIRTAWASVADVAIVPLQDILGLGSEARMNTPGTTGQNWQWRFTWAMLSQTHSERLRALTRTYGRGPKAPETNPASSATI